MGPCQMEAASALLTTSTAVPRQGQAKAARRGAMSARPKGVMRSTPTAPAQRSDKVGGKENPSKSRLPTANQFRCKLRAMMKLMAATHFLLHTAFRRIGEVHNDPGAIAHGSEPGKPLPVFTDGLNAEEKAIPFGIGIEFCSGTAGLTAQLGRLGMKNLVWTMW